MNIIIITDKTGIGKAMVTVINGLIQVFSNRLPGDRPVIFTIIIPKIYIMTGPIQRNTILAEAGNPPVFGTLIKGIATGIMRNNRAEVLNPQVIGPGDRYIRTFNYIFPVLIIKITITHSPHPFRIKI